MKKKILSIALVLGILLSIISSIPVSATGEVYERTLPYAFFDYEDGVNNLADAELVDGGVSGSGKCLKIVSTAETHEDRVISLGKGGTIPAGHTFKLSFNLMLPQELTNAKFLLHLDGYPDFSADPTKVGEWQKVEFVFTPNSDKNITSVSMRFGHHGTTGNHIPGAAKTDPRTYYIDDMEVSVVSPYQKIPGLGGDSSDDESDEPSAPVVPVRMTLNDYTMDFENGSSINVGGNAGAGRANVTTTESGNANRKAQLIADPTDSENTVLKIWLASYMSGEGEGKRTGQSTIYDFSMNLSESTASTTLATGSIPPGATWTLEFDYYLPEEMENNDATFCFYFNDGSIGHFDPTVKPSKVHGAWHHVTMNWTNNGTTTKSPVISGFRLQGCSNHTVNPWKTSWALKGYTGSTSTNYEFGDRSMYFDNFRSVIDDPNAVPPAPEITPEEAVLSLDSYSMNFETDSSIQVNGANVTDVEAGLADEKAVITADPKNADNKVLMLTTTSSYSASDSTIMFSGAVGANPNPEADKVTAPGTIPAGGKVTYRFKYYIASEVNTENTPAFSVKHITGNVRAVSEEPFATETNVWHEAELTYTNNKANDLDIDGAVLSIAGDDANATQWKAQDGDMVIYFDDFTVETKEPAFPTSAELKINGKFAEGEEVTFYHTYTPTEEGAEDKSIVRFLYTKNGVTGSLGSCLIGTKFTVPAVPKGGVLSFEVAPVDSDILGVKIPYSYASVVGEYATLTLDGFENSGVTATAMIDNERDDSTSINAVLIVVLLNEKGGIVKYAEKPMNCEKGNDITETLTLTADDISVVTKAEAYLWYCADGQTASFTNSTLVELVEDESVVK